jgi:hypothetical protein
MNLILRLGRSAVIRHVTRIALGIGTMAVLISVHVDEVSPRSARIWDMVGWVGIAMITLSLPGQLYVLYLRLSGLRRGKMLGERDNAK